MLIIDHRYPMNFLTFFFWSWLFIIVLNLIYDDVPPGEIGSLFMKYSTTIKFSFTSAAMMNFQLPYKQYYVYM